ncbi:Uncharacterised protein [Legionella wadsworthii]|uniref:Uncharacterized protein n=1 Tax=Legionella wadsworthii TaxID=28088 RepID=A0A378LPD6_9GAMM|nr:hypothetical protein [Legionella wadsworthii]STY28624.1 Uncharacterised protein [Legionella wadsworthii]
MKNEPYVIPGRSGKLCWSAVVSGALVAIGINIILNMFEAALGISTFYLNEEGKIFFDFGGTLGILIGIIVSMLTGGYTAGYLGRYFSESHLDLLYGFLTWITAIALSSFLILPINQYASYVSNETSRSIFMITKESDTSAQTTTVETNPSSLENDHKTIKITATPESLIVSAHLIFILFFLGAVFACIGSRLGMKNKRPFQIRTGDLSEING